MSYNFTGATGPMPSQRTQSIMQHHIELRPLCCTVFHLLQTWFVALCCGRDVCRASPHASPITVVYAVLYVAYYKNISTI